MDVRTYEAVSMRDAVKAIKAELGSDAVILSTRQKPSTEASGHKMIEVTAASATTSRQLGAISAATEVGQSAVELMGRIRSLEQRIDDLQHTVAQRQQVEATESALMELKVLMLDVLRTTNGSVLKDVPAQLVDIDRQLRIHEVDDTHISALIQSLKSIPEKELPRSATPEELREFYRAQAVRWMLKRIRVAPRWATVPGTVSVHAFVGGTGVGKTATVAKIGSHFQRKERARVLIVSHESLKIAGSDQLRVLCKVMDLPFVSIASPAELPTVLGNHRDVDIVLVDTSGRSPKNDSARVELESYTKLTVPVDFHLMLPVTSQQEQLDRTVRYFSPLGIQSLIFTKLDEGWRFGSIFNECAKWSLPLSYFGIGQSIPEDLERATRERVIERIFGI